MKAATEALWIHQSSKNTLGTLSLKTLWNSKNIFKKPGGKGSNSRTQILICQMFSDVHSPSRVTLLPVSLLHVKQFPGNEVACLTKTDTSATHPMRMQ